MDIDSTDINDQFTMKPKQALNYRRLGHMTICFFVGFLLGLLVFRRIEDALDYRSCPKMKAGNKNYGGFQTLLDSIKTFGRADLIANENVLLSGRENKWEESNWKERSSSEVSDNFLFVGIMTARKFLDTRAMASHRTWVPRIPGKVVYFLGEGEEYTGDLNVVILKGVKENDYPPQKKSFAMVEYMAEHYAKHYKWLIRADDDVYMKVDDLVLFLQSINDTTPRYLGQPGFGKPVEEGKLGLSGAFCMGGPGVIMTNQVVRAVAPALKECLKLTVTGHEDTELGRCITISTGIQCTTAFEMKHLFYQNYQELDQPNSSFKKALGEDERRALTLHPVKEARYVFRMHNFFNNDTLQELERKKNRIRKQIMQLDIRLDKNKKQIINLGKIIEPRQDEMQASPALSAFMQEAVSRRPDGATFVNLDNIPMLPEGKSVYQGPDKTWEFIRYKRLFSTTIETGKIEYPMEYRLRPHLHDAFTRTVKNFPDFRKSPPHFVNQTYHKVTANRGAEALLFLKRRHQNRQYIQPLFLRRPFHDKLVDFRESDSLDEDKGSKGKKLYLLMPLYQRSSIYKRFLDMFNRVIAGYDGKVQLRVVVFIDDRGEHKLISAATYAMMEGHPHLDIRMNYLDEPFNRGRGLMTALADLPYGSLLLFMDVDMEFTTQFLYRVSKHTVLGKSAFFPIYFVHYNPESICYRQDDCDTLLDSRRDEVGLWRSFSYGIGSVYKKDLVRAGGFKTNIVGWGLEDVDFYEKCLVAGLDVLRGSDAGMIHRYHPRECNTSLPATQLIQCQDSGNAMLGSVANLYTMLSDVSHGQEG